MAHRPRERDNWVSGNSYEIETKLNNVRSGKTLGGSSSINGGAWTRGLAAQYDAWSSLLETSEAQA